MQTKDLKIYVIIFDMCLRGQGWWSCVHVSAGAHTDCSIETTPHLLELQL